VQICRQGRSFYRHVVTPADAARFPFPASLLLQIQATYAFALQPAGQGAMVDAGAGKRPEKSN
jgi:hypothetical protein